MNSSASVKRSPLTFFVLVFAFSLLFWLLVELFGPLAEHFLPALPLAIPSGFNPVSPLVVGSMPLIAACILVSREGQSGGTSLLFSRVFDLKRIRYKIWYVPILFLNPLIYVLSYAAMRLLRFPLPQPPILWLTIPIVFVYFFLEAAGEEGGWTGYVTDPLQNRWGALQAGLILGIVTAIWHVIPGLQAHQTLTYIAWQGLCDVAGRILGVWLYNNTGKSVCAVILSHDMYNVGYVLFPNTGSHYDPAIAFPITAVLAIIVTFLWGAQTLARFRYASPRLPMETAHRCENGLSGEHGIFWSEERVLSSELGCPTSRTSALTGKLLVTYRDAPGHVTAIQWAPDGRRIATASDNGTVKVWDVATGRTVVTSRGQTAGVWTVSWSPDGTRIASGSGDHRVQVWNATTGNRMLVYRGHSS